jgi:hypothetical protein
MKADESNIGVFLWFVELFLINMWIPMDIWLTTHGHETLTVEFREGLSSPLWGPALILLTVNTVVVFFGHMWLNWW